MPSASILAISSSTPIILKNSDNSACFSRIFSATSIPSFVRLIPLYFSYFRYLLSSNLWSILVTLENLHLEIQKCLLVSHNPFSLLIHKLPPNNPPSYLFALPFLLLFLFSHYEHHG